MAGFVHHWIPTTYHSENIEVKNIQKTKIMASSPITSWQIDGETVADFILGGSKITVASDCSHEIIIIFFKFFFIF